MTGAFRLPVSSVMIDWPVVPRSGSSWLGLGRAPRIDDSRMLTVSSNNFTYNRDECKVGPFYFFNFLAISSLLLQLAVYTQANRHVVSYKEKTPSTQRAAGSSHWGPRQIRRYPHPQEDSTRSDQAPSRRQSSYCDRLVFALAFICQV